MKTHNVKKLSLNKNTVANLEQINMENVHGGRMSIIIIATIAEDTCLCTMSIGPQSVCGDCWTLSANC